ncbi:MAG: SDR family oxidoreductase [Caulobacterales bacterium]
MSETALQEGVLEAKVAFITGAGSGIGRATALAMAREGARVAIADRDEAGLNATRDLLSGHGADALVLPLDITDSGAVVEAIASVVERYGRLDIAHNNAGIALPPCGFEDYELDAFRRVLDINLMGTVNCMQAEIRQMLKQGGGGAIVNTASAAGVVAAPGLSAYIASKSAVIGLTRAAAVEFGARGIRINSVSPGYVYTPMTAADTAEAAAEKAIIAAHPIGRLGKPEEIAETVVWLASGKAGYLLGANIMADGGYTAQ